MHNSNRSFQSRRVCYWFLTVLRSMRDLPNPMAFRRGKHCHYAWFRMTIYGLWKPLHQYLTGCRQIRNGNKKFTMKNWTQRRTMKNFKIGIQYSNTSNSIMTILWVIWPNLMPHLNSNLWARTMLRSRSGVNCSPTICKSRNICIINNQWLHSYIVKMVRVVVVQPQAPVGHDVRSFHMGDKNSIIQMYQG